MKDDLGASQATGLAGAEAPEPHSRLGPTDGIPSAKVVRDGKVAVLVSRGFGAGWYSRNTKYPQLLFDPEIVEAVEMGDEGRAVARASAIAPNGYFGGSDGLEIEWVPIGRRFRVNEYDGSESLILDDEDDWIVA